MSNIHMMRKFRDIQYKLPLFILALLILLSCIFVLHSNTQRSFIMAAPQSQMKIISGTLDLKLAKTDAQWQKILTPVQYHILREAGTEVPFTGALEYEKRKGTYYSAGCNEPVFRSEQKYDSGTGWPSFWAPITTSTIVLREDDSLPGESRIEVLDKCGGHLGHLFDDGPQPTGKRYCINSGALVFVPDPQQ